jgi:transposase-like protein
VQFVIESGHPVTQVARELQTSEDTLGNWISAVSLQRPTIIPFPTPTRVRRVPDAIVKATHFFSRLVETVWQKCWPFTRFVTM